LAFVGATPFIGFAGLMAVVIYRTLLLKSRGIRAIVDTHEAPRTERVIKRASMVVWWTVGAISLLYVFNSQPSWMPDFLRYQIHNSPLLQIAGAIMCLIGAAMYPFAQSKMGDFWRIGIDRTVGRVNAAEERKVGLVTTGIFKWSRNPIYVMNDAVFIGGFFVHGQVIFLVLALAYVAITHFEILEEERFLRAQFGEEYVAYSRRVGRYFFV
jgi:protein-S-isoprenylcysteine O-methyltransferase Ste14